MIRKITFDEKNSVNKNQDDVLSKDKNFRKKAKNKAYLEFSDFDSVEKAINEFKDNDSGVENLKVKYLVKEKRDEYRKQIDMSNNGTFSLNSDNIGKIVTANNGVSYERREEELRREVQRHKLIQEM